MGGSCTPNILHGSAPGQDPCLLFRAYVFVNDYTSKSEHNRDFVSGLVYFHKITHVGVVGLEELRAAFLDISPSWLRKSTKYDLGGSSALFKQGYHQSTLYQEDEEEEAEDEDKEGYNKSAEDMRPSLTLRQLGGLSDFIKQLEERQHKHQEEQQHEHQEEEEDLTHGSDLTQEELDNLKGFIAAAKIKAFNKRLLITSVKDMVPIPSSVLVFLKHPGRDDPALLKRFTMPSGFVGNLVSVST